MMMIQSLALALAFAMPPEQPPQPGQPGAQPSATKPPTEGKTEAMDTAVQAEVLPAMVGIHSGNMAAMALYELASGESSDREAARKTVELADDALELAQDSVRDLDKMKGLSEPLKTETKGAMKKLETAKATVDRLEKDIGKGGGTLQKQAVEKLRKDAAELHAQLIDAERSMDKIASAHGIPTQLGMPEHAGKTPTP